MIGRHGLIAGGTTMLTGIAVLLAGLLMSPHLLETGQVDPRAWLWPGLAGLAFLLGVARWLRWRGVSVTVALPGFILPPLLLCLVASGGGSARFALWRHGPPTLLPQASQRPAIGLLSGPVLHGPPEFAPAPLWLALSRIFEVRSLDAIDAPALAGLDALLVIQPRALAPDELVALDAWVRMGGRAVLLADSDLRWADARPLGHPLRAPPATFLGPLLTHWGVAIAPPDGAAQQGDPVERRVLEDGWMVQLAGASRLFPNGPGCVAESRGLVARCRIGRGTGLVVADADFANDALWTAAPDTPLLLSRWTSDAVPFLADLLASGAGVGAGRRVWLERADGVPAAFRMALMSLLPFGLLAGFFNNRKRTKRDLNRPVPS